MSRTSGKKTTVTVNRGDQDSYYKSAASKLSVSKIKKEANKEIKLINRYKIEHA